MMCQLGGRHMGKTEAQERFLAVHLKIHPKATVIRVRGGETIIEKYVEPIEPKRLSAPGTI